MELINDFHIGEVLTSPDMNAIQTAALGHSQIPGIMVGLPYVYSTNGVDIKVGPIAGVTVSGSENDNLASNEISVATSGLDTNQFYHLYAYNSSGAIACAYYTKDDGPPDGALVFQNVPTVGITRRYLCSFRTNGSGAVLPFRKTGNLYLYDQSNAAVGATRVVNLGHATSFTDQSLSTLIPAHVRVVKLRALLVGKFNSWVYGYVQANGGTGDVVPLSVYGNALDTGSIAFDNVTLDFDLPLTDRTIEYLVSDAVAGMSIYVLGYYE